MINFIFKDHFRLLKCERFAKEIDYIISPDQSHSQNRVADQ